MVLVDVMTAGIEEACTFMSSLELSLDYTPILHTECIDMDVLRGMCNQDLVDIGVNNKEDRSKILAAAHQVVLCVSGSGQKKKTLTGKK